MSRKLPYNLDAEASILGGVLLCNDTLKSIDSLEVDDFYDHKHKVVFDAIRKLEAASRPIDVVTLENEITKSGKLEAIGGVAFLGELTLRVPTADNVMAYAEIVRGHHAVRKAMVAAQSIITMGYDGETEPSELLAESIGELQRIDLDLKSMQGARLTRRGFVPMSERVATERAARLAAAQQGIPWQNAYLEDRLRVLLPHDLVLLTARSGAGKTSMALDMAVATAMRKRRVAVFALEAEENELERKIKFRWIIKKAYTSEVSGKERLDFMEWMLGKCEDMIGAIDGMADAWFRENLSSLRTYYKGTEQFDSADMDRELREVSPMVDMIVLDHLHYVDIADDESENRSQTRIIKTLRDRSLALGKPVIAVAHLRKPQGDGRTLVPSQADIMGSSNIPKVVTHIVAFAPAPFVVPQHWWQAPTLMQVIKDRRLGEDGLAAVIMFDKRSHFYAQTYTLGRLAKGGSTWEPLTRDDIPRWATGHRDMDASMLQT